MLAITLSQFVRPATLAAARHTQFSTSAALWQGKRVTQGEATSNLLNLGRQSPHLFWILIARAKGVDFKIFTITRNSENPHREALQSCGFVDANGDVAPVYADELKEWFSK